MLQYTFRIGHQFVIDKDCILFKSKQRTAQKRKNTKP